jgi:hypothetical protein
MTGRYYGTLRVQCHSNAVRPSSRWIVGNPRPPQCATLESWAPLPPSKPISPTRVEPGRRCARVNRPVAGVSRVVGIVKKSELDVLPLALERIASDKGFDGELDTITLGRRGW